MEKKSNPAVSVIIPVYNAEKYLRECLDSLLVQTMTDFEILCVNDGSSDNSPLILEEYAAKDKRIRVITKENQGCGPARNIGIDQAQGEYLIFLDADDFFEKELLEKLYKRAKEKDADLCMCRFRFYDTNTHVSGEGLGLKLDLLKDLPVLSYRDCHDNLLMINTPAIWANLYRTEMIRKEGLRFQALANTEDVYFIFMASVLAEKITWISDVLVNYRKGITDSVDTLRPRDPLCFIEAERGIYHELKKRGIYEELEAGYVNASIMHIVYSLNRFSVSLPALAKAERELVFSFFPETGMLDHPDSFYQKPKHMRRLRHIRKVLKVHQDAYGIPDIQNLTQNQLELLDIQACIQEDRIHELQEEVRRLKNSPAYRTGKVLTWLPGKIRKAVNKKKQ